MFTASINGNFTGEPFHDEKETASITPGWGIGDNSGGGGGDGSGYGGGGGNAWIPGTGWGSGGGGGDGGDDGDEEEDDLEADWHEPSGTTSAPYLRTGSGLYLLSCGAHLLRGTTPCPMIPILGQIDGKDADRHCRCLLFRTTGKVTWKTISNAGDFQFAGRFGWIVPQEMKIELKWQAGHHDIAEFNRVRLVIFGIDLGWVTLALGNDYREVATIRIGENTVFVNSLKADFAGNLKYLE